MSLETFLTIFWSYLSYFGYCGPLKIIVEMWKAWVSFNFSHFQNFYIENSEKKNQENDFKIFHFLFRFWCWNIDVGSCEGCFRTLGMICWPNIALGPIFGGKTWNHSKCRQKMHIVITHKKLVVPNFVKILSDQ